MADLLPVSKGKITGCSHIYKKIIETLTRLSRPGERSVSPETEAETVRRKKKGIGH